MTIIKIIELLLLLLLLLIAVPEWSPLTPIRRPHPRRNPTPILNC